MSSGRYRLYKRLFIELDHSGVLGLLVHQVKEEVMSAIEVSICINVLFMIELSSITLLYNSIMMKCFLASHCMNCIRCSLKHLLKWTFSLNLIGT